MSEVIFIEDTKSSNILGKVVKVDGDLVLVKMQNQLAKSQFTENSPSDQEMQAITFLDNLRIFQKSQLQLIKSASSSSSSFNKIPDFMQKTPKKLSDFGNVLCLAVQQNGVHAIVTKESSLFYVVYDLLSNKIVKEKRFPSCLSFMASLPVGPHQSWVLKIIFIAYL